MNEVESVALWVSLIVGIASVVLAVVAIVFSWRVSARDNTLNVEFATLLGEIRTLSNQTQEQLNEMSSKVVDAFIDLRKPPETAVEVPEGSQSEADATMGRLNQVMARLQEVEVRQRFQSGSNPRLADVAEHMTYPRSRRPEEVVSEPPVVPEERQSD